MYNRCDYVTFVSQNLSKNLERIEGLKIYTKKKIIYGGVKKKKGFEKEDNVESFQQKFEIKHDENVLLWLGPLALKKKVNGIKILLEALKSALGKEPKTKIRLLTVGNGVYRKELEDFAKSLGLSKIVTFTGNIENPAAALSAADIYTHISLSEGLPMALLEAMIMEKPIIATRAGGIPETIINGKNGILVDATPEAVADAILSLLKDPKRRKKLGKNAKKTAEEKFTWEKTAKQFIMLYYSKTGGVPEEYLNEE